MSFSYFAMMYEENLINNIRQRRIQKEKCNDSGYNSQEKVLLFLLKTTIFS